MEPRYSLRFESGERRGETIPITASGFSVGRRPGSSLQVLDNSVSGHHAEFLIDDHGVTVRDLESTNGTRVGEMRVIEQRLAHGDHVTLGNIEFVLLDERMGGARTALEALAKTKTVPGPDGLQRVSADVLARSKKVSRPGLIVVALLVVAGGTWFWLNRGGGGGPTLRAVTPVAGDQLADEFSFESDHDTWANAENAPQAFYRKETARWSGALGVAADVGEGEWALYRSRDVRAAAGREFVARAMLRASEGVTARVGIEFTRSGDAVASGPGPFVAWSDSASGSGFEEREVAALVPPGYDAARAVLFARAPSSAGSAAADDVSLVERASEKPPAAQVTEYRLVTLGASATQALLFKGDRVLLSALEFTRPGATPGWDSAPMTVAADAKRITLSAQGASGVVALRCESALVAGGIATLGSGADPGYKTHASEFERAGVLDLLLGGKGDFVRLHFKAPVRARGAGEGAAARIVIDGAAGLAELELQLEFKEEREQAGNLAHAARNAEKKGDLGDCLAQWSTLLDTFPYEDALVAEAEATRAKLLQKGLAEVREVRAESERARFFRLVDLYRKCRDKALAIGKRYAKSDVEREAQALAADVERDLAGLEADLDRAERARLTAILQVLEKQKASGLAGEVKAYLDARSSGGK
ncbi:MAG: FHA domain-containing protein [Planctomycetes bacterium]|nr:FHA domain-containing protein [Planctomycetota bacterium]